MTAAAPAPLAARHPTVAHLRRLSGRRRSRQEHGQYVVEGPTLVLEALAAGLAVDAVYVDGGADAAGPTLARVRQAAAGAGVPVRTLAPGVMAKVSDVVTPQPALAVVHGRPISLDAFLATRADGLVLVLAGVSDPGNAGTLVRTAEAVGAVGVIFAEGSVDPLGPKTVRGSAGSVFRVPVVAGPPAVEVVARLRQAGDTTVGTTGRDGTAYTEYEWRARTALVLGAEAAGLAPDVLDAIDECVTIPMLGRVESLNVSVAGSLLAFEWARHRHRT